MLGKQSAIKVSLRRILMIFGGLIALVAGCGEPTGRVHGKLLLDGAPYTKAKLLLFDLATGHARQVEVQRDGTFAVEEPLPVGVYTVSLSPVMPDEATLSDVPQPIQIDENVPRKYWNEATSDLTIEVVAGENVYTIKLEKETAPADEEMATESADEPMLEEQLESAM